MAILEGATDEQIALLLDLFPVTELRTAWPSFKETAKTKDELCAAIAEQHQYAAVTNFVDAQFGCTKQHVYVFARTQAVSIPASITDGERVQATSTRGLYLASVVKGVVMQEPLEHETFTFLWPIRIDLIHGYVVVRFVVLEKNLSAYFPRKVHVTERGIAEINVLQGLIGELPSLASADITKGLKKLWRTKFMDGLALIRFGGHVPKGGYDVQHGSAQAWPAYAPALL